MKNKIAIAHALGICYCAQEDVAVRVADLQKKYGQLYRIEIGTPESFASRIFQYHTLDDVLDSLNPERKIWREKQAAKEAATRALRKLRKTKKPRINDEYMPAGQQQLIALSV